MRFRVQNSHLLSFSSFIVWMDEWMDVFVCIHATHLKLFRQKLVFIALRFRTGSEWATAIRGSHFGDTNHTRNEALSNAWALALKCKLAGIRVVGMAEDAPLKWRASVKWHFQVASVRDGDDAKHKRCDNKWMQFILCVFPVRKTMETGDITTVIEWKSQTFFVFLFVHLFVVLCFCFSFVQIKNAIYDFHTIHPWPQPTIDRRRRQWHGMEMQMYA